MKTKKMLGKDVQTFIVRGLACFETPSEVARAVKKEFGVEVTRQAVESYDPTKAAGSRVAMKWRALFDQARDTFVNDVATIPIAQKGFRLRSLQRMMEKCERMGNLKMAAELLEQAAKEVGGMYTNKYELSPPQGSAWGKGRTLDDFYAEVQQPSYRLVPVTTPPIIDVTPIRSE